MNADRLRGLVSDYFARHAAAVGLDPNTVEVEYVLNWGGFVNHSYRIRDARRAYHLKLSSSAEDQAALRRWMTLSPLLERYHAPPILQWIDLGAAAGPLFPSLAGEPPTLTETVVAEVIAVLRDLNGDRRLADALRASHTANAHVAYQTTFHHRFVADLQHIRASRPSFVGADLVRWLDGEVAALLQHVASSPAFDETLTKPVHGDLWLNNILWVDTTEWYLVDWDDLRIGDPAADLATLLGPTAQDPRPLKMLECAEGLLTSTERDRLPLLGRATLLDWVIDPLSDWIDAGVAPEHEDAVRSEKERIHKRALACYQEMKRTLE